MVHMAKKAIELSDDDYRDILIREYGVSSAAALSMHELADLVDRFRHKGWQPKAGGDGKGRRQKAQAVALREKARAIASRLDNGEKRLSGLCKRICGVNRIEWVRDVEKLKHLLAVLARLEG